MSPSVLGSWLDGMSDGAPAGTDSPVPVTQRRWRATLSMLAFVALTSLILVLGAERMYWTFGGLSEQTLVLVPMYYLVPTAALIWTLAVTKASSAPSVVLGAVVFAFVTEGVLTPVLYEDGPLPLLALMFVGWHGVLAVLVLWYGIRRLLLERRLRLLAAVCVGLGLYWGVWSLTWTRTDPMAGDPGFDPMQPTDPLTPMEFLGYALGVGVLLAVAHWLLGWVWPATVRPGRVTTGVLAVVVVGYLALVPLPVVPWAPIKLVLAVALAWALLRPRDTQGPDLWQRLSGRVPARAAATVLVMPLAAAGTYACLWRAEVSEAGLDTVLESMVLSKIVVGAGVIGWASLRMRRRVPTSLPSSGRLWARVSREALVETAGDG